MADDNGLRIREMLPGEEQDVWALVLRVFGAHVAPDFSPAGIGQFVRSASGFVLDRPAGHRVLIAEAAGERVGMVDLRDGSHVTLFFVDSARQRSGVGRTLLTAAIAESSAEEITVNAAPSAVPAYVRLGFEPTAEEQEIDGIRFVAMRKMLR